MLAELRVENLVLIQRLHLLLDGGLNVFTGETGAGKSLLIDALGLLFGGRAEADAVRPGAEQAEVSARFELADAELVQALGEDLGIAFAELPGAKTWELVVSRVLPRDGRARAHANGRPVAAAVLKTLGEQLLDVHGQHENQSLLRPATRLEILDRFAEAGAERAEVRTAFREAREAAEALVELRRAARDRQGREDVYRFQLKELDAALLDEIEPESLEGNLKLLRGAERIRQAALAGAERLDGDDDASAASQIAHVAKDTEIIEEAGAEGADLSRRLDALLADARELARDLNALAEKARSDPERLAELEEARARWRGLERKHGRDLEGLRKLRDELRCRLADLGRLDDRAGELDRALEQANAKLRAATGRLTRKRSRAARELERRAAAELTDLGLKGATLRVALAAHEASKHDAGGDESAAAEAARLLPAELRAGGAEGVELLFTANPELAERPLSECASGGELSRVMLALKGVLAKAGGADRLPVVVFDEIDTGVGGRMGEVLGRKLQALARVRQVLCVTHLPQLAACGARQFKIEKLRGKGAAAEIAAAAVEGEGRVEELALMLRGESASERTLAEAREMLDEATGVKKKPAQKSGKKPPAKPRRHSAS